MRNKVATHKPKRTKREWKEPKCKFSKMLIEALGDKCPFELAKRTGYARHTLYRWLVLGQSGRVHTLEDVLNACGYELVMRKIDGGNENEHSNA